MKLIPLEPLLEAPNDPLMLGIPTDLVFDDDSLEPLLDGTQPSAPTPASVVEIWRQGLDRSEACARALAAVLIQNPDVISAIGDLDDAEQCLRMAMESKPRGAGASLPAGLAALGRILELKCEMAEAGLYYRKALELQEKLLGTNHEVTRATGMPLLNLSEQTNRKDEAVRLRNKMPEAETGFDATVVRTALRRVLLSLGRNAEARNVELKAKEHRVRERMQTHPHDATNLSAYAVFLGQELGDWDGATLVLRQAIELAPGDAAIAGSFAYLLANILHHSDEAERYYRRAIELNSRDPNILANFALFVQNVRRNYEVAAGLYKAAMEINPDDPSINANYASLLIILVQFDGAGCHISRAWEKGRANPDRISARSLVLKIALRTLKGGDISLYLGQFKTVLQGAIMHGPWMVCAVLEFLKQRLSVDDFSFFDSLCGALTDQKKVPMLNEFDKWTEQEALPLDKAWDEIAKL